MANRYEPGDIFLVDNYDQERKIRVEHRTLVLSVDSTGWPTKVKSLHPDDFELGKCGWFYEDGDWVIFYLTILECEN